MGISIVEGAVTLTWLRVWLCVSDSWELFFMREDYLIAW